MSLAEILYGIAYITFVIGAGWYLRATALRPAWWLMAVGLLLDFTVTIAPPLGCTALKMQVNGSNTVLVFAVVGGVLVWAGGFLLLALHRRLPPAFFQKALIGLQVLWFVDYIAFAYGMHVYPLR